MTVDSKVPPPEGPFVRPRGVWTERVRYATNGAFAYRPGQVVASGARSVDAAQDRLRRAGAGDIRSFDIFDEHVLLVTESAVDVESVIAELRAELHQVEPNYVLFAHGGGSGGCGCPPCGCGSSGHFGANPFMANPFMANPFMANPFMANPFMANPFMANPFMANPFMANFAATGMQRSSARPADAPGHVPNRLPAGTGRVIVLDTGIAPVRDLPELLKTPRHLGAATEEREGADENNDDLLDPVSGHGTFIAGIIEQLAPGHDVQVFSVLSTFGDGDAVSIAKRIDDLRHGGELDENTILNMSFGSYADANMHVLAEAVRLAQETGTVVVASAGNDGVGIPSFPACLPGVVSVGSIDECGRAPYSNFGTWVRACAPGSDVVSSFFAEFIGKDQPPTPGADDPDDFAAWAEWSGTSFAAPLVAAALVRHIALRGGTAKEAVDAIIDAPALGRIPGLGTVVNLVPGM